MKNVSIEEVERINDLISKAEMENAKNSVFIENIEDEWQKKFGTTDVSKIEEKLNEMKSDLSNSKERLNKIYSELMNSQNWEELEEELS